MGATTAAPSPLRSWRGRSRGSDWCGTAKRAGQSAAIASGVEAARAPWIATLDGDGQNDPADILPMLELVRTSSDPPSSAPPPLRPSA